MLELNIQLFADGKVEIETELNDNGFKQGLEKMQNIAKKGFKAIATSVGVVSTALAGLVMKSVNMAGELEQQIGGTEAVFGEFAATVQDKAAKAFDQMGISANDFMATANKMGALMQGSGISVEKSMDLSTKAMQRAADVASIMGIDINDAMNSIAGAAKGNFTMMDNLGVAMNATTIEAYAMSKGIKESYNEMDNATKIGLAMEMFLEKTAYAEGNYMKENETFAGSFNTLKAAMSNFLSGAGGIKDVSKALIDFGKILINSIIEMAPDIISGLVELTNTIMKELPSILKTLLPTIINGGISIIKQLLSTLLTMLPQVLEMGITILLQLIDGIVQSIPKLIPTIVSVIKRIVEILMAHLDEILTAGIDILLAVIDGIIEALPDLIDMLPMIISQIVVTLLSPNNLMKLITAGIQILVAVIKGILQTIPQLLLLPANIILDIVQKFRDQFKKVKDVGKDLISGLWNGIKEKWEGLKNKVADFGKGIVGKFKSVFGIKSPSKVMRDQIGKNLADGIGVGFEDQIDGVYRDMQRAIDYEQSKLNANVESGNIFNSIQNSTPVAIEINADVEMDSQKVGRLVTPAVTRTIKNGGGV